MKLAARDNHAWNSFFFSLLSSPDFTTIENDRESLMQSLKRKERLSLTRNTQINHHVIKQTLNAISFLCSGNDSRIIHAWTKSQYELLRIT